MKLAKELLLLSASASLLLTTACSSMYHFYTDSDSGKTAEVKTGDLIYVDLEENPTTGYLWTFGAPIDDRILIQYGDTRTRKEKDLMGAPCTRNLTFKVIGPGKTGIKLEYRRPWEKDAVPIQRFDLMIVATGEAESNGFLPTDNMPHEKGGK